MSVTSATMQVETVPDANIMAGTPGATPGNDQIITGGRVKWFNNKLGYGFISYGNPAGESSDIFVHYSQLKETGNGNGFKTLFQGEYVDFKIIPCTNSEHEIQASEVTGINGGPLFAVSSGWSGTGRRNEEGFTTGGGGKGKGRGRGMGAGVRGPGRGGGRGAGQGPDMDI